MAVRIPIKGQRVKKGRRPLTKEQKYNYSKRTFFVLIIILLNLLQNTAHVFPTIFGAQAFLLIPFLVCTAMFEKNISGTVYAIIGGALWDVSSGFADGFYALFFMVVISVICILMTYLLRNNMVSALILSGGVIVFFCLIHWLVFYVARGADGIGLRLAAFYLPSAVYTFAFTPLFYLIIRKFMKKLRNKYPNTTPERRE